MWRLASLQACERGREGERYILGSENLTLAQILGKLAAITGRPAPTVRLPYAVAYAAGVTSTAWARVTGKPPRAPLDAVRMARKKMFVSHAKAARELGFRAGTRGRRAHAARWNGFRPTDIVSGRRTPRIRRVAAVLFGRAEVGLAGLLGEVRRSVTAGNSGWWRMAQAPRIAAEPPRKRPLRSAGRRR